MIHGRAPLFHSSLSVNHTSASFVLFYRALLQGSFAKETCIHKCESRASTAIHHTCVIHRKWWVEQRCSAMYHSCSFIGLFCKRDLYTSVNHGHQLPFITHLKGAVVDTCLSLCVYLSLSTICLSLSPSHVNTYQHMWSHLSVSLSLSCQHISHMWSQVSVSLSLSLSLFSLSLSRS